MPQTRSLIEHLPTTTIIAVTQTAIGCGIGLLLGARFNKKARNVAAIAMLAVGAASTLPVVVAYVSRHLNRPESARAMQRRLDSIRRSFAENA